MVIVLAPVILSAVVLATTFPTAIAIVLTVEFPVVTPTEVIVTFPMTKFAARLNTVLNVTVFPAVLTERYCPRLLSC